jgi:hypothetical protein
MGWWALAAALPCEAGDARLTTEAAAPTVDDGVVRAALGTYVHGMTPELATSLVGRAGIPTLRVLLRDPGFPRRDNVVAMIACLDDGTATEDLLASLAAPQASLDTAEEDRAMLLAPQALGDIAARGDDRALQALLDMVRPGADGGVLRRAAQAGDDPAALLADLLRQALVGLARAGAPEAIDRLEELAGGGPAPVGAGLDVAGAAAEALDLAASLHAGLPDDPAFSRGAVTGTPVPKTLDAQVSVHDTGITYANHVEVPLPMVDEVLDLVLRDASLRAGRAETTADVACCITLSRAGTAGAWGKVGDGLAVVDTSAEMTTVLNTSVARAKVVRLINDCGGAATNIIGCAWTPGNGMAMVRMSSLAQEGITWIHEYGHNTGSVHSGNLRDIMYALNNGLNDALTQAQCDRFHSPHVSAMATPVVTGSCGDADGDGVHDLIDNCLQVLNPNQLDSDLDGVGDVCDPPDCGNNVREGSESCDGIDLGGQTCVGLGHDGGVLSCNPDCTLNASLCTDTPGCPDADGDGYQSSQCNPSKKTGGGDCNDADRNIRPGAPEICGDGIDQDCNGRDKPCRRR